MYKLLITMLLVLGLVGCHKESVTPDPVIDDSSHCSNDTVLHTERYGDITAYYFDVNTCNELEAIVMHTLGTDHGKDSPFIMVWYRVDGLPVHAVIGEREVFKYHDTECSLDNLSQCHDDNKITFDFSEHADYMVKYNTYTTNTDYIYDFEEEFKMMSLYLDSTYVNILANEALLEANAL